MDEIESDHHITLYQKLHHTGSSEEPVMHSNLSELSPFSLQAAGRKGLDCTPGF